MPETYTNELTHHGILGQKWGKKNGPPYPLDYSKLSAEERSKAKGKAIQEGNIKEAATNINYYSNDELRAVKERFNLNSEIASLNAKTVKTGAQRVDSAIEWLNRGKRGADAVINAYNVIAKTTNAFAKSEDEELPLIGEKKKHKNKAESKTKAELLELIKSQRISTEDYIDVANRLKAMGDATDYFKNDRFNEALARDMAANPNKYSKKQINEMASMIKNLNKISNFAEGKKDKDDDDLEHSYKGTTWSKDASKAKYKKKEKLENGRYRYYYDTARNYSQMAADLEKLTRDETNKFIDVTNYQRENAANSVIDGVEYVKTGLLGRKTVARQTKVHVPQSQANAVAKANVKKYAKDTNYKQNKQKAYSDSESLKRMSASATRKANSQSKSYKVKASLATKINKAQAWLRKKRIQRTYAKDAYGWRNRKTNEYVTLGDGFIKKYLSS